MKKILKDAYNTLDKNILSAKTKEIDEWIKKYKDKSYAPSKNSELTAKELALVLCTEQEKSGKE